MRNFNIKTFAKTAQIIVGLYLLASGVYVLFHFGETLFTLIDISHLPNTMVKYFVLFLSVIEILIGFKFLLGINLQRYYWISLFLISFRIILIIAILMNDNSTMFLVIGLFNSHPTTIYLVFPYLLLQCLVISLLYKKTYLSFTKSEIYLRLIIPFLVMIFVILYSYNSTRNSELITIGSKVNLKIVERICNKNFEKRKQPLLLIILVGTNDCPKCLLEKRVWNELEKKHNNLVKLIVFGYADSQQEYKRFVYSLKLLCPTYRDAKNELIHQFNLKTPKRILLNDKNEVLDINIPTENVEKQEVFIKKILSWSPNEK